MARSKLRDEGGALVGEHYYLAGAHVYEMKRGVGMRRAKVAFEETPSGDGAFLWEENDGRSYYRNLFEEDA